MPGEIKRPPLNSAEDGKIRGTTSVCPFLADGASRTPAPPAYGTAHEVHVRNGDSRRSLLGRKPSVRCAARGLYSGENAPRLAPAAASLERHFPSYFCPVMAFEKDWIYYSIAGRVCQEARSGFFRVPFSLSPFQFRPVRGTMKKKAEGVPPCPNPSPCRRIQSSSRDA